MCESRSYALFLYVHIGFTSLDGKWVKGEFGPKTDRQVVLYPELKTKMQKKAAKKREGWVPEAAAGRRAARREFRDPFARFGSVATRHPLHVHGFPLHILLYPLTLALTMLEWVIELLEGFEFHYICLFPLVILLGTGFQVVFDLLRMMFFPYSARQRVADVIANDRGTPGAVCASAMAVAFAARLGPFFVKLAVLFLGCVPSGASETKPLADAWYTTQPVFVCELDV